MHYLQMNYIRNFQSFYNLVGNLISLLRTDGIEDKNTV